MSWWRCWMRRGVACVVGAGLLAGVPVGTAGAEDLAPLIKPLVDKITELRKARKLEGSEVTALRQMMDGIRASDCGFAESPVICQADALRAALGPLRQAMTGALTEAESDAIDRLANAIVDAAAVDPNIGAARVARILAVRLAAAGIKRDQAELAQALDELAAFVPAKAEKADGPKVINVIGAFYGDLDAIRDVLVRDRRKVSPKARVADLLAALQITDKLELSSYQRERYCSATQAIRATCQGLTSCLGAGTGGVNALTAVQLCGYTPAPYAESRFKGLVIGYQCVPQAGFRPFEAWLPEAAVWPPQAKATVEAGTKGRAVEAAKVAAVEVRWVQFRPDQIAKIACDGGGQGGTPPKTGAAGTAASPAGDSSDQ